MRKKHILSALKHNFLITMLVLPGLALTAIAGEAPIKRSWIHPQPIDSISKNTQDSLEYHFKLPPRENRPGVIWQWVGGMISKEGITKDLEALAAQGIGGVLVLQVIDQPAWPKYWAFSDYPGKVKVLSDEWFGLVSYAIGEADRLGLTFSILICPGWSHAGIPQVTPDKALKRLHSSKTTVTGPVKFNQVLPVEKMPELRDTLHKNFYRDVAVLAVPATGENGIIAENKIIELTKNMDAGGRLKWDAPAGQWTIVRLGITADNSINHPAPPEAVGLECDRMDPAAVRFVFDGVIGRILREAKAKGYHSFKAFETDSYEAGFQDFGLDFREQFKKRRGYDCVPWLPTWINNKNIINSPQLSGRFRADMIRTITELHAERFHDELRRLADENKVEWMTEPYFMLPIDWRTTGARSRMPGAEFWVEANSNTQVHGPSIDIAALYGLQTVWAESFTSQSYNSAWRNDPLVLKPVSDKAFCAGVNQLYFHGFTHNPFGDNIQPGFTMAYWGTQLNRYLTWWPYSASWHQYLARCSYMLKQGRPVNDVLAYPPVIEHLPVNVVKTGPYRQVVLNDEALLTRLSVNNGRIHVKGGGDFAALALTPNLAVRPEALQKIRDLVKEGATLIGTPPPPESSSLENYPACDKTLSSLIDEIWGKDGTGALNERVLGKGKVLATTWFEQALDVLTGGPDVQFGVDYADDAKSLNFGHRRDGSIEIYFVCNSGDKLLQTSANFRVKGLVPEQWDPVTGEFKAISWHEKDGRTILPLKFEPRQSFFIVFKQATPADKKSSALQLTEKSLLNLDGSWDVAFDPKWGGPEKVKFDKLEDWTKRPEKGIRFYSGTASYQKTFDLAALNKTSKLYLELGVLRNLARVSFNGRDLGVVWCAPWHVELPQGLLKKKGNTLTIDIVNTWVNRLIGDEYEPVDTDLIVWDHASGKGSWDINIPSRGLKDLPAWLIKGEKRPSAGRYTFGTWYFYNKDAPLLPSGLLGPVKITSIAEK